MVEYKFPHFCCGIRLHTEGGEIWIAFILLPEMNTDRHRNSETPGGMKYF